MIPPSALSSAYGAAAGPESAAPTMIGDTISGGLSGVKFYGTGPLSDVHGTNIALSGGSRRFKMSELESPVPLDRVFFEYNHFQNTLLDVGDGTAGSERWHNLDRFSFGLERTFRDGLWSFELRVPFAGGFNSTQTIGGSLSGTEFGDMSLAFKRALIRTDRFTLSAGLNIIFPTGSDYRIVDSTGTLVEVWNEAVHLNPFFGALWSPTDRLFVLFFGQMDFDTHGNRVLMAPTGGGPLSIVDTFHEQTQGFLDLGIGYRLFQNPDARILTGITPIVELHYTSTLTNMDYVTGPQGAIGAAMVPGDPGRRDILNMTGGVQLQFGPMSTLTVAGVVPLRNDLNRQFDSEVIAQFERRF